MGYMIAIVIVALVAAILVMGNYSDDDFPYF